MPKQPTSETQVTPDTKLGTRKRRKFRPLDKLCIIQKADNGKHGELNALLPREKIYSTQLSQWRREYADHGLAGLDKSVPCPVAAKSFEQRQIEKVEKQVAKLRGELDVANHCLDMQKKLS